jgi:hypothetical protein
MALEIYVEAGCWSCDKALLLAEEIARRFPALIVEVIDVGDVESAVPEDVFAVPTYVLNGKVVSLGNPSESDLSELVQAALARGV